MKTKLENLDRSSNPKPHYKFEQNMLPQFFEAKDQYTESICIVGNIIPNQASKTTRLAY